MINDVSLDILKKESNNLVNKMCIRNKTSLLL